MTIIELQTLLEKNPDKNLRFILPDKTLIPPHFHITEVGNVQKDFIDCGGTRRSVSSCLLQAWVAANDENHALSAGRLASILGMAEKILSSADLPVEIEYENPLISQFPIERGEVVGKTVIFHLTTKHTDCLAKEQCGLESESSCCSSESDCCS